LKKGATHEHKLDHWLLTKYQQRIFKSIFNNCKMNRIKRILGILWILLAPVAIYYLVKTGLHEMQKKPVIDTKIQWMVFIVVFIPIAIGLIIFGYYAWKGEYDHLPESSEELT